MSKLVTKLRQVSENAVQPIGFRAAAVSSSQRMVLIASLAKGDADAVLQLAKANIDAVLIHGHAEKDNRYLQRISPSAGDMPWGVRVDSMTEALLEQLKEAGADFLVSEAATSPATLLQEESIGKVLRADLPQDESVIAAFDDMPVDAVLLDVGKEGNALTISDLMQCHWLAGLVDKPLLAAVQRELSDKDVQSLWEAGVKGLVVEVSEREPERQLTRLSQAIDALPAKAKKRGESRPVLPRVDHTAIEPQEPEEI